MAASTLRRTHWGGLLLPAGLLVLLCAGLAGELGGARLVALAGAGAKVAPPPTIRLAASAFTYHPPGDYEQNGAPVSAPLQSVRIAGLDITAFEISKADYGRCVADGACRPARPRYDGTGDVPAVGVSFNDASDYAGWLSAQTGEAWRLPTMAEWDFAADGAASERGARLAAAADPDHPWLADLADQGTPPPSPLLRPLGGYGTNARGVADMDGNVWEWTSDCNSRTTLAPDGHVLTRAEFCGVRFLEGPQRMPMSAFIDDARGGGCLATAPPDNMGFRLVREHNWYHGIVRAVRQVLRHV